MLFAVEGGGFFSASASGYSEGLAFLLLGQTNEERHMKVSPWNQYQLVEQESNSDKQLGPTTNQPKNGCSFFACFRHQSPGLGRTSPTKLGPALQSCSFPYPSLASAGSRDSTSKPGDKDDVDASKVSIRSILKKPISEPSALAAYDVNAHQMPKEEEKDVKQIPARKKVHWIDTSGKELAEIREFESSSDEAASDFGNGGGRICGCAIQ